VLGYKEDRENASRYSGTRAEAPDADFGYVGGAPGKINPITGGYLPVFNNLWDISLGEWIDSVHGSEAPSLAVSGSLREDSTSQSRINQISAVEYSREAAGHPK